MAQSSRAQVQVIWLKEADANPNLPFPQHAQVLEKELEEIVRIIGKRFVHAKLCFVSSRSYGGYATTTLNPEPFAYESGFAVKWLIDEQIKGNKNLNFDAARGELQAPWLAWGPYLWADGTTKRADGLFYEKSDFSDHDGTHPSPSGKSKIANLLLQFFKTNPTTKGWFLDRPQN